MVPDDLTLYFLSKCQRPITIFETCKWIKEAFDGESSWKLWKELFFYLLDMSQLLLYLISWIHGIQPIKTFSVSVFNQYTKQAAWGKSYHSEAQWTYGCLVPCVLFFRGCPCNWFQQSSWSVTKWWVLTCQPSSHISGKHQKLVCGG